MEFLGSRIIIVEANLTEQGTIEIIKKRPSGIVLTCYPPRPAPDEVWKEIYGVVGDKIQLMETIEGKHTPAHNVSEKITFTESNNS